MRSRAVLRVGEVVHHIVGGELGDRVDDRVLGGRDGEGHRLGMRGGERRRLSLDVPLVGGREDTSRLHGLAEGRTMLEVVVGVSKVLLGVLPMGGSHGRHPSELLLRVVTNRRVGGRSGVLVVLAHRFGIIVQGRGEACEANRVVVVDRRRVVVGDDCCVRIVAGDGEAGRRTGAWLINRARGIRRVLPVHLHRFTSRVWWDTGNRFTIGFLGPTRLGHQARHQLRDRVVVRRDLRKELPPQSEQRDRQLLPDVCPPLRWVLNILGGPTE